MGRLDGKVAVITGGAGGMGSSHVKTFINEGAKVVVADLDSSRGKDFAEECGENAIFIDVDVTSESSWKELVAKTEEVFGPINILVNNAGIVEAVSIEDSTIDQYRKTIEINQDGTFMGMKFVLPSMKKANGGSIINISSTSGFGGSENMSAYTASKFAVRGLTKAAAAEFAPFNIRVNSVHPGTIQTPMVEQPDMKEKIQSLIEGIPLKRLAQPQEISNLVLFLATDESSYSTGNEFVADGGLLQTI